MSSDSITTRIATTPHIPHRLDPIYNPFSRITVIDDSYNGNLEGVQSAIHLLSNVTPAAKWLKRYLTPGLVELGNETASIHRHIGELLANSADRIILIKSSWTPYIREALDKRSFPAEHIFEFATAAKAHSALGNLLSSDDVILFQNDIPDFAE